MTAPICPYCETATELTDGREIYPTRAHLYSKAIWICRLCDARVSCHSGTQTPLGIPANAILRSARGRLHKQLIDPLWKTADRCGLYRPKDQHARKRIRKMARERVYAFMADKMGLSSREAHTGMFDIEQCHAAWRALRGVTYPEIREWAQSRQNEGETV